MSPLLRNAFGIGAGFVTVAALSVGTDAVLHDVGLFPPVGTPMSEPMFVLAAAYRAVFTVLGGMVATWVSRTTTYRPAQVLSGLGLVGGLAGLIVWATAQQDLGPLWYAVSIPVSAIPCTLLGASLVLRSTRRPQTAPI